MNNEELLRELESLVAGMEDSLTIITGTLSEACDPTKVLHSLLAAEEAMKIQHGQNDWRDRLMRSARQIAALKARNNSNDPDLQALISNVLANRKDSDPTH